MSERRAVKAETQRDINRKQYSTAHYVAPLHPYYYCGNAVHHSEHSLNYALEAAGVVVTKPAITDLFDLIHLGAAETCREHNTEI